jgi:hypothetical protein
LQYGTDKSKRKEEIPAESFQIIFYLIKAAVWIYYLDKSGKNKYTSDYYPENNYY